MRVTERNSNPSGQPAGNGHDAEYGQPYQQRAIDQGLSFRNLVSVRVFLTRFSRDYAAMNAIYASYFAADRRPARTTVGVTALARDGIVEIDMIAVRP